MKEAEFDVKKLEIKKGDVVLFEFNDGIDMRIAERIAINVNDQLKKAKVIPLFYYKKTFHNIHTMKAENGKLKFCDSLNAIKKEYK